MLFSFWSCSWLIYSTNVPLLCEMTILPLRRTVNAKDLQEGLHFKSRPLAHDAQWKEGMNYFCWLENDCIDCYVGLWRSVVKVELWNMIGPCRNLQLQIVWNWLGVLVLFGRLTAIGSIYLLRTTKVSGKTERGSQTVIFLLFTFCLCPLLSTRWGFWSWNTKEHSQGFPCFIFGGLMRMDRSSLFLTDTQIPNH